ncbi:MAG: hypothetical protein KAJ93_02315 [Methanosarcinales archaeon]|nr:hypothetical protein [Methanosarcinales archaeon]
MVDQQMTKDLQAQVSGNTRFLKKAYGTGWIRTIADLEAATYGQATSLYMTKDAPVLTSTTGVRNVMYGARLWEQIVTAANAIGVMGAKPWVTSGYRAITDAAATTSPGSSEGSALSATIKPTFAEIDVAPTSSHVTFEQSDLETMLEGKDDTILWSDLVEYMSREFSNRLNRASLATADTVPTTGIESLDRIIGSYAEIAYGKVDDSNVLDAGDLDIYGLDRDAGATFADAYVNGQAYGSGSRTLALSHIDAMFTNCRPYWDGSSMNNKAIITGYDTLERIEQLLQAQQRFAAPARVQFTVNGIQTVSGAEAGFDVASYKGVPIIPDSNVLQDTLSRIMLLDLDNIHLGALSPTRYLESGDFFALDKMVKMGMYYMHGEIVCTKFKGQGKVRDLQ